MPRATEKALTLAELQHKLLHRPVLLSGDPFVPVCLPPEVEIVPDGRRLTAELDRPSLHKVRQIAILSDTNPGGSRFSPSMPIVPPAASEINRGLPARLDYVQQAFLRQSGLAAYIAEGAKQKQLEAIVLMVVDGLGYSDVHNASSWPWPCRPCFVDGASITRVGYPQAVGSPSLERRLWALGLKKAYGFSYWERNNALTARLFAGIPITRVSNFPALFEALSRLELRGAYVQIVREGLDRLAHHRREVSPIERTATVEEISRNCEQIANLLQSQRLRACLYVTADHGILWKSEHRLVPVPAGAGARPRYSSESLGNADLAVGWNFAGDTYYSFYYPYIGAKIRDNDAGVHGGCSYEESFVPLVEIEV